MRSPKKPPSIHLAGDPYRIAFVPDEATAVKLLLRREPPFILAIVERFTPGTPPTQPQFECFIFCQTVNWANTVKPALDAKRVTIPGSDNPFPVMHVRQCRSDVVSTLRQRIAFQLHIVQSSEIEGVDD